MFEQSKYTEWTRKKTIHLSSSFSVLFLFLVFVKIKGQKGDDNMSTHLFYVYLSLNPPVSFFSVKSFEFLFQVSPEILNMSFYDGFSFIYFPMIVIKIIYLGYSIHLVGKDVIMQL